MKSLAYNFKNNINIVESFEKLAEMLGKYGYRTEQCFCYESACRFTEEEEKISKLKNEIVKCNEVFCENSYEIFFLYNSPIDHEFEIKIHDYQKKELITFTDRYLGLLHTTLLLEEKNMISETIDLIESMKSELLSLIKRFNNKEMEERIHYLMDLELNKVGNYLASMDNLHIMLSAVRLGYKEESLFIKIIEKYIENNNISNSLIFYNEQLVPTFNKKHCLNELELCNSLIDGAYMSENYYKALELEIKKVQGWKSIQGVKHDKK